MPHTPLKLAFRRPWPGTLRGLIIWEFGLGFILVGGLQFIRTIVPEPTRTYLSFALELTGGRGWPYGVIFLCIGLFACVTGYCHFDRDRWGYTIAAVFSAAWALVYVSGYLFYEAPLRAVGASILWFVYASIIATCARIPKIVFGEEPRL